MIGMGRWNSEDCQTRVKWFKVRRQKEEILDMKVCPFLAMPGGSASLKNAPYCGSTPESRGKNTPAGLAYFIFSACSDIGRGGLVVRCRPRSGMVPGSKPDASEDPLCIGPVAR
ncbi:hypothetical protein AVEN_137610-1 [Araneus ventricosus]|uniref:Uncharacterized protein n=1 Tax=Araneus ventricosus TaxID=182803 RepID=A0A4Y2CV91_ARAVE|nr:hypothetical protein AVEN_137610-1 [Araneus ventricosus]